MTFLKKLIAQFPELTLLVKEPMSRHTSFRIGGPATIAMPKNTDELIEVYRFCIEEKNEPLILGAGTNILAPDNGLERLVICTKQLGAVRQLGNGRLEADSGALMSRLASFARDCGLTGLEFAHGIPGTVGGGVYMNAGAYGGEMSHVVVQTQAILPDGSVWTVDGVEHCFGYRHSIFEERKAVILKTTVELRSGDKEQITEKMKELALKRRASQPLELPSAGSTFKRPANGYAAAMIDGAGLKGKGVGDAVVSEKHAGFVVNLGNATAADVLATMDMIKSSVYEETGIVLEPEVRIW